MIILHYSETMTLPRRLTVFPTLVTLCVTALFVSSCTQPVVDPVTEPAAEVAIDNAEANSDLDDEARDEEEVWPKIVVFRDEPYPGQENCQPGPDSICEFTEDGYVNYLITARQALSERFGNVPFEFSREDWTFTFTVFPEHQALAFAYFDEQIDYLIDVFYMPQTGFADTARLVEGFELSADRTELTVTLINAAAYTPNLLGFALNGAGSFGWDMENWMLQHQEWQGRSTGERSLTVTYLDGQTGNVLAVEKIL
jgi:hypothetical protein